jgi:GNAT superfamily N-acetyltransferase
VAQAVRTTDDLVIRAASAEDSAPIADLLTQLGYPCSPEEAKERLATWRADDRGGVLAAVIGTSVVGFVAVHAIPYFERSGSWARICALAVDRLHRRAGVGRRLVHACEEAAAGWGCATVEVTSSRTRDDAHAFYRRLGYEDACGRSGRFVRELG